MKILFTTIQIVVVVCFTIIVGMFFYSFPDSPLLFRQIFREHRIEVMDSSKTEPDKRFLEWFNRDPERVIPQGEGIIVAPADGVVEDVLTQDGYRIVVIEMRYTDVHVQRAPLAGKVISIRGEGKPLPADESVGSYVSDKILPYKKVATFETDIGVIHVHLVTSLFAKRISVFPKVGEKVQRGQRIGRVLAGSTVILEAPKSMKILVEPNQEVIAGETVVGNY